MMKRAIVLFSLAAVCGCPDPNGSSSSTSSSSSSGSSGTPDAGGGTPDAGGGEEDAGPPVRTITETTTLFGQTSINNLLLDPLFKDTFGGSGMLPVAIGGQDIQFTFAMPYERTTPSETSGALLEAVGQGYQVAIVSMFSGGSGPYYADVWVSPRADGVEQALPHTDVTVRVGEAWLGTAGMATYDLVYVPADDKTIDGLTWYHYVANITEALPPSCVLTVIANNDDVGFAIAGAQVVPVPLRMHAHGQTDLVPFKAVKSTWTAREMKLLQFASEHGPRLAPPPRRPVPNLKRR